MASVRRSDFSEEHRSIFREAIYSSETPVLIGATRRNFPEDNIFHCYRRGQYPRSQQCCPVFRETRRGAVVLALLHETLTVVRTLWDRSFPGKDCGKWLLPNVPVCACVVCFHVPFGAVCGFPFFKICYNLIRNGVDWLL
jgi:hypothetical protein